MIIWYDIENDIFCVSEINENNVIGPMPIFEGSLMECKNFIKTI